MHDLMRQVEYWKTLPICILLREVHLLTSAEPNWQLTQHVSQPQQRDAV